MNPRNTETPAHARKIPETVERYFRETAPAGVVSAYVFGGHAEDRVHRESDVDVAVLLDRAVHPGPRERFDLRVSLTSDLIGALRRNDVDLVILNDAPPELGRRVVTAGLRVYRSDAAADDAFVRHIQLRAADLAPFLRRMRRIKRDALLR